MRNLTWKMSALVIVAGSVTFSSVCFSQTKSQGNDQAVGVTPADHSLVASTDNTKRESEADATNTAAADPAGISSSSATADAAPGTPVAPANLRPELMKELDAMKRRIAELETELNASGGNATDASAASAAALEKAKSDLDQKQQRLS